MNPLRSAEIGVGPLLAITPVRFCKQTVGDSPMGAPRRKESLTDSLVIEHISLAKRIAGQMARRGFGWVGMDELEAAAMFGLTEAAQRYDSTRGEPFGGFATKRIRGAILDHLRSCDPLPRRARFHRRRVQTAVRDLEHSLGRKPDEGEVAENLGVSVDEYREHLSPLAAIAFIGGATIDQVPRSDGNPSDQAERAERVAQLRSCLQLLAPRDAKILSLYYQEELTYQQIGNVLAVTESRVCQLHTRALKQLRKLLGALAANDDAS